MEFISEEIRNSILNLSFSELQYFLFCCEAEENAISGKGTYKVEGEALNYSGIAGWFYKIRSWKEKKEWNKEEEGIYKDLRRGGWMVHYIADRLSHRSPALYSLSLLLHQLFCRLKVANQTLPEGWSPDADQARPFENNQQIDLFVKVIEELFHLSEKSAISKMSDFIKDGGNEEMIKELAMGSIQMMGEISGEGGRDGKGVTMAAGLPHFSVGYMRCWGRDTFISLPGLLLATGRREEARKVIEQFAKTVRHGLVPNLLDGGRRPRYNARDATWWFLNSVRLFANSLPPQPADLSTPYLAIADYLNNTMVERYFAPYTMVYSLPDLAMETGDYPRSSLADLIQEIFTMHVNGINFREFDAGPSIDDHMSDEGFHVSIRFDKATGLIFGGSPFNCGTWMDKMGHSVKAGNISIPATPRDGADIEIIALLFVTVKWLADLYDHGAFPYQGVDSIITYSDWAALLHSSVESHFYIPLNPEDDHRYHVNSKVVHRRGIYKDVVGSRAEWSDYQLRPNFPIALAIAPELFDREHAKEALRIVEENLEGKLGMKTLDPDDWNYFPYYSLSDSDHFPTACGFSYHNGPEWVWLFGFYLIALLNFSDDKNSAKKKIISKLNAHKNELKHSEWGGLPELTNKDGQHCSHSCPSQAWSFATLLYALYTLHSC